MGSGHKILLLDDEQELLNSYGDLLRRIPSQPEVRTSSSGTHALALLESEPFTLLITDLKMPQMDGLQVLSVARGKFPHLRIVVLTSVSDETYRARAYAMGAELFWVKPFTREEIRLFQDCIESLLNQETHGGFRGMQSKSLVDIIQFECMSRSSSMLRIFHGAQDGTIWLEDGEVIDARTGPLMGEEAFQEIFLWHSGNFEMLPAEKKHPRRISTSYQALLLDSAQALDESLQLPQEGAPAEEAKLSALSTLAHFEGVEFVLVVGPDRTYEAWGLENAEGVMQWAQETQKQFCELGATLNAGELLQMQGCGTQRHVAVSAHNQKLLCVGFQKALSLRLVHQTMKEVFAKWTS